MRRSCSGLSRSLLGRAGVSTLALAMVLPMAERANAAAQAVAQASAAAPASKSVVINLIRLLVQEGVLTQDKANALIHQAEDEAAMAARGQTAAVQPRAGAAAAGAAAGALATAGGAAASTSVRVPYIPEIVKKQIRDEVKQEVMQQARAENWAAPDMLPEWTRRIKLSGDFRFRYEADLFDKRNSAFFPNFAALNSSSPFDLNNAAGTPPSLLDTTKDRDRERLRFRLGLDAEISDEFHAGLRLATGNTTNPVTTNQTLGTTLNKDNFLLDRGYLTYQPGYWGTFWAGRFANPWLSTDLVWDDDLNFDGVAATITPRVSDEIHPFLTLGVFSIENTAFNFPDNSADKQSSSDKWLYAAQIGTDWRPDPDYAFKIGLAYYHYQNVEGRRSGACVATTSADPCDTDNSRPGFLQQGNTLFALRNLVSTTTNPPEFQYYGLASQFHELNFTTRADFAWYDPVHVILDADFVTNLGFNRGAIAGRDPVNNRQASTDGTNPGTWSGGADAFMARLTVGYPQIRERWDWNVTAGYKYIESDAVIDAFNDSDFHLGGTNAKGYFFGGALGVAQGVDLTARWLSAREVTGSPYSVDVIQVDLNGRF